MKKLLGKYWKILLSLAFGLVVFWFWAYPFASVLSFQEQYQLFLFDAGYFLRRLAVPGGMANYIAEFFTQFYYVPKFGAAILAVILVAFQRLTWLLSKRLGAVEWIYPLTFLTPVALWWLMGDENVMLSSVVALLAALLAMYFYLVVSDNLSWPERKGRKTAFLAIGMPLLYWCFGPVVLLVALFVLCFELWGNRSLAAAFVGLLATVYAVALILISALLVPYPLFRLFGGVDFYRYPAYIPLSQMAVMVFAPLLPFLLAMASRKRQWGAKAAAVAVAVVAVTAFLCVKSAFGGEKYSLIEYDYLLRSRQWTRIISEAEKKKPTTPVGVATVNLALAMQGQLSDRLFSFYQHGAEGLLPAFRRDMTTPIVSSEVFFQLGMVNDAGRYAFEAQQAIPNFRQSGRLTKRIVECEIVNGQYAVARKNLNMLQKTLFYSKWAGHQLDLLQDEASVDADSVYGRLRKFREQNEDYLFSDTEMDQMLGLLFVQNHDNRMAYEYLMCYELLQKDLEKFNTYYPLGKFVQFDHIPTAYQQALVFLWAQNHSDFNGMPWSIHPSVCGDFVRFMQEYQNNPNGVSSGMFANTFWAYLTSGASEAR